MKTNNSFSSLPTGAHLHSEVVRGGRFVFKTIEKKNSLDSTEKAKQSIDQMMNRLDVKSGTRKETKNVKDDVESTEKKIYGQDIIKEAERMRAEMDVIAEARVEEEFKKLNKALNEKLVEVYSKESGKTNPDEVKEWIRNTVASKSSADRQVFIEKMIKELEPVVEKEGSIWKQVVGNWAERKNIQSFRKENNYDTKTRVGNALGAGLTTYYVVGIFAGPTKKTLWYSIGTAAALSSAFPGVAADVYRAASNILYTGEIAGKKVSAGEAVDQYFTHIKNALVGVARLDSTQMWDGQTETNDRRSELMDNLYSGKIERPKLKMRDEDGKKTEIDMIDETMHNRFKSPLEGEIMTQDQCERAAQFCVEMFDPSMLLTSENITSEQKAKLDRLKNNPHAAFDYWDEETLQLISRTFASGEAVLAWNYFMIQSDKEKEMKPFARAFADKWEAKKRRQRGMLPEEIKAELDENLKELYPDIDAKLAEKSPEGIASFMKEGGLEDLLVLLGVAMAGVYTVVGLGRVRQYVKEWNENRKNSKGVEKYLKKRREAKTKLKSVLNKSKMKQRDWKDALKYLYAMEVINEDEKKKLAKLEKNGKMASKGKAAGLGWGTIVLNMKKNEFPEKEATIDKDMLSVQTMQAAFWACVQKTSSIQKEYLEIGALKKGKESLVERRKARVDLAMFKAVREGYEKALSEVDPAYSRSHGFFQFWIGIANKGRKAKEGWQKLEQWGKAKKKQNTIAKWKVSMKMFSDNKAIYERLLTLGVHENTIKMLKSIPKKGGERKRAVYEKVTETLDLYKESKYTDAEKKSIKDVTIEKTKK